MSVVLKDVFDKTQEDRLGEKFNLTKYLDEDVDAVIFRVVNFNSRTDRFSNKVVYYN